MASTPGGRRASARGGYRQVDGVRYDKSALILADDSMQRHGRVTLTDAKRIYEDVQDGVGITETEWRTLKFIAEGGRDGTQYKCDHAAVEFLASQIQGNTDMAVTPSQGNKRKKQYRRIAGVRYDESALGLADMCMQHHGVIRLPDAESIVEDVRDGPGITETEWRTLAYIHMGGGGKYNIADEADAFFARVMQEHGEFDTAEDAGRAAAGGEASPNAASPAAALDGTAASRGGEVGGRYRSLATARIMSPTFHAPAPPEEWYSRFRTRSPPAEGGGGGGVYPGYTSVDHFGGGDDDRGDDGDISVPAHGGDDVDDPAATTNRFRRRSSGLGLGPLGLHAQWGVAKTVAAAEVAMFAQVPMRVFVAVVTAAFFGCLLVRVFAAVLLGAARGGGPLDVLVDPTMITAQLDDLSDATRQWVRVEKSVNDISQRIAPPP